MTVRRWRAADTETLWTWITTDDALWRQMGFTERPTRADVTALIADYEAGEPITANLRAVERDGELVALVSVRPRIGSVGAVHLVVSPAHRGEGQAIGAMGLQTARALGLKVVTADLSGRDQQVAARWLRGLGFTPRQTWQMEL